MGSISLPPAPKFTLGYRPSLDGIRGVGVLTIMLTHSFLDIAEHPGDLALQVFFLLSGFLITSLLLREWQRTGRISLRHFYIRRALRLLPALAVFLLVSTTLVAFTLPEVLVVNQNRAAFSALFYVLNWAYVVGWVQGATIVGHCWSLSVEEQFYLVWPLALIGLLRLPVRVGWKMATLVVGILASLAQRAIVEPRQPESLRLLVGSDMHADAVLLGCLLAMAACWGVWPTRPRTLALLKALGFVSLAFLLWHTVAWENPFGYKFESVVIRALRVSASGIMFLALIAASPALALRVLESPFLVWFGRRSYGIYLWHVAINAYVVILFVLWNQAVPKASIALAGAALSITIAALSFRWIEAPFLRLKIHYSSEPAAAVTVIAQLPEPAPALASSSE